jgi:cytochrome c-type biogenesis protein CcmF
MVVGGSLTLYAMRAPAVSSRIRFAWLSRDTLLLINNVFFLVATLTVLFGTLFPLLMDALGQGKYSVGPPYFNAVFVPLMAVLVPFMGIGPTARWKQDSASRWQRELLVPALVALALGAIFPWLYAGEFNPSVALAVVLAGWLLLAMLRDLLSKLRNASSTLAGLRRLSPSYYGMQVAHLGFAAAIVGVVLATQYSVELDLKMSPGDSHEIPPYRFTFDALERVRGPNYLADEARFTVTREGVQIASMAAQKRRYLASGQIMTEAAIDGRLFRDLFIAMGEPINEQAWAIRLQYKPFLRWIWGGAIAMALGGFLTLADRRYRRVPSAVADKLPGVGSVPT